jgi:hypothetical protein
VEEVEVPDKTIFLVFRVEESPRFVAAPDQHAIPGRLNYAPAPTHFPCFYSANFEKEHFDVAPVPAREMMRLRLRNTIRN